MSAEKDAPDPLNSQIVQAVHQTRLDTLGPAEKIDESTSTARQVGQAAAYEAVAQATAFAVQDAAAYMRNVGAVTQAALAVVAQEMMREAKSQENSGPQALESETLEKKSPSEWGELITQLKTMADDSVSYFESVGSAAANVAKSFPAAGTWDPSTKPPSA